MAARSGWAVVVACFFLAVFAWGFGFYGQSVFVAELTRLNGWSSASVSGAVTVYYLLGALAMAAIADGFARWGARATTIGGALLLGGGASLLGLVEQPWQLYPVMALMALGWAATSTAAIGLVLAPWFEARRGMAVSLALNGASAAGFTLAPGLLLASEAFGFASAVAGLAALSTLLLVPLLLWAAGPPPPAWSDAGAAGLAARGILAPASRWAALASPAWWTLALPFCFGLAAQAGFLTHQVAYLRVELGTDGAALAQALTTAAAVIGRVGLSTVIDRLNARFVTALLFAAQSLALVVMWAEPGPLGLYAAQVAFGLGVGNAITLPAVVVQREYAAASFGLALGLTMASSQITFAAAPLLMGWMRDLAGDYGGVLLLCVGLDLAAAAGALTGPTSPLARRRPS